LRADDLKPSALLRLQVPHSSYPLADWQERKQLLHFKTKLRL
jgi:hypothetical protein